MHAFPIRASTHLRPRVRTLVTPKPLLHKPKVMLLLH